MKRHRKESGRLQAKRRSLKQILLSQAPVRMNWSCRHLDLGLLAYRAVRQYISVVWGTPICGTPLAVLAWMEAGVSSNHAEARVHGNLKHRPSLYSDQKHKLLKSHILWTGFHSKLSTIDAEGLNSFLYFLPQYALFLARNVNEQWHVYHGKFCGFCLSHHESAYVYPHTDVWTLFSDQLWAPKQSSKHQET